jgi:hypothetical protein
MREVDKILGTVATISGDHAPTVADPVKNSDDAV